METIRSEKLKARKEHFCNLCGCKILKGETYERQTNKFDGRLYAWRTHLHCQDLCSKIWNFVDPDEGMNGDEFIDNIRELMDTFYCPYHCDKYEKDTGDCKKGITFGESCIREFAKFMDNRELRCIRDADGIPRWRVVEIEVNK